MASEVREGLQSAQDEAKRLIQVDKPRIFSLTTYRQFFASIPSTLRLALGSPEIVFFSLLQWASIVIGYLIWTQLLRWIPDESWAAIQEAVDRNNDSGQFIFLNFALLAWSFIVVVVIAYPVGLCSAAMVAVHDLRTSGEVVTIAKCIAVADRHLSRIWAFTIADSWITVWAILDRLPKKHGHRSGVDELLYYAWKVGTAGVIPALVNGRTLVAAGRDSIKLLRNQPARVLGLRLGYSAVCWVIGIATYVSGFFVPWEAWGIPRGAHYVFKVYLVMALPICFAVAVICLFLRPLYILGIAKLYTEEIDVRAEVERDVENVRPWEQQILSGSSLASLAALLVLVAAYFFGDQIGLSSWVAHLGRLDVMRYRGY